MLVINKLHWPMFLSLLLNERMSSFPSYMVRRSAPKEAHDRPWQGLPPHSGNVSKAASYL